MTVETIDFKIQTRTDTAANWATVDPIPLRGEMCLEEDTFKFKVGDGSLSYNNLPYWGQTSRPGVKTIATTTYTLTASDENHLLLFTNVAGCTVTFPADLTENLPVGFITHLHQEAAGQVVGVADTGAFTRAAIGLKTRVQYSSLSLIKQAANTWKIIGDAIA